MAGGLGRCWMSPPRRWPVAWSRCCGRHGRGGGKALQTPRVHRMDLRPSNQVLYEKSATSAMEAAAGVVAG